jgi:hypothetical protein
LEFIALEYRGTLEEKDWQVLVRLIKKGKCTPFVGAGACTGTLPRASEIAEKWAKEYGYPLSDSHDLARVSQFMAIDNYAMFPKECIKEEFQNVKPPDFSKSDEPHAVLADLNLPIYITTNYDSFMISALCDRKKSPTRDFCRWNKLDEVLKIKGVLDLDPSYQPSSDRPLVYHLHGYIETPQSMVLTESDYLDFLIRLQHQDDRLLPDEIVAALAASPLLFIGYSLSDWNFRVLFRGLLSSLSNLGYFMIAVQLPPEDLKAEEEVKIKKVLNYLNLYYTDIITQIKVHVYWGDARQFVRELREHLEKI